MNLQEQFTGKVSEFQATLKTVRVDKKSLLEKLKENRAKHESDFKDALKGYHLEVKVKIQQALDNLCENVEYYAEGLFINEAPPENHLHEYDKVITMLEMSLDTTFFLTESEVNCYILDNWNWKHSFTATATKYISNVR